ncbi:MAG: hypothetical protein IJ025_08050 [Clostridia bacterium]|nr:hypothetical protein [Clostridia bacterium]
MNNDIDISVNEIIEKTEKEIHYKNSRDEIFRRGNSWIYCYNTFKEYSNKQAYDEKDYDFLALNLSFYLASWGMYRGSSFLLNMDYKIHIEAVKMMMKEKYRQLFDGNIYQNKSEYKKLLFGEENFDGIYVWLNDYYTNIHNIMKSTGDTEISDTLITKILLGVYGCIPAFDRFFKDAFGLFGGQKHLSTNGNAITNKNKGLLAILETELGNEIQNWGSNDIPYMKKVDMYFYSLGEVMSKNATEAAKASNKKPTQKDIDDALKEIKKALQTKIEEKYIKPIA